MLVSTLNQSLVSPNPFKARLADNIAILGNAPVRIDAWEPAPLTFALSVKLAMAGAQPGKV